MDGYGLTLVPVWPQVCLSLEDSGSTKTVSVKMHELQELAEESRGIEGRGNFQTTLLSFLQSRNTFPCSIPQMCRAAPISEP